jgi:hypothetical protein
MLLSELRLPASVTAWCYLRQYHCFIHTRWLVLRKLMDPFPAAAASADVSWNRRSKKKYTAWSIASTAVPCLGWLRSYKLREWLLVSSYYAALCLFQH